MEASSIPWARIIQRYKRVIIPKYHPLAKKRNNKSLFSEFLLSESES